MDKNILLQKYRTDSLTDVENEKLEQLIAIGEIDLLELDDYDWLNNSLELPTEWSSTGMDHAFRSTLKSYKDSEGKISGPKWWQIILPILLIVLAFSGGYWYSNNGSINVDNFGRKPATQYASSSLTETLLNTTNVAEKINLVSATKITNETDGKVIQALLFALNNDPSSNVRIACVEALFAYANLPTVRQGFIQAISSQSSPVVLSRLAEAINIGGQLSQEEFRDKLNKDLPDPLLESMEASLINL